MPIWGPGGFELRDANNSYDLRGHASELQKYVGEEVAVEGVKQEVREYMFLLTVSRVKEVSEAPQIELSKAITDSSNWHFQTNELYGVKFALPTYPGKADSGTIFLNFVDDTGTVTLVGLAIPSDIQPEQVLWAGLSCCPSILKSQIARAAKRSEHRILGFFASTPSAESDTKSCGLMTLGRRRSCWRYSCIGSVS